MKQLLRPVVLLLVAQLFLANMLNAQLTRLSDAWDFKTMLLNGKPLLIWGRNGSFWKTDGTPAGTIQYTSKVLFDGDGDSTAGRFYFFGKDATAGRELWVTDGTDAGTSLVKDITPGTAGTEGFGFMSFKGRAYFFAKTNTTGAELWVSDGTADGTHLLKDINPGPADCIRKDNVYFFIAGDHLCFVADDGVHGREFWKTDGTEAGTVLLKDIYSGEIGGNVNDLRSHIAIGKTVYFVADDGNGPELWKTDGTSDGTRLVKDINQGVEGSYPGGFIPFNNKLFFSAGLATTGRELWVTDGSESGTKLVKDLLPGTASSYLDLYNAIIFGNKLVFIALYSGTRFALWETDGTTAGTQVVKEFGPEFKGGRILGEQNMNIDYSNPAHLPLFNGKIFMEIRTNSPSTDLWETDGTASGTRMVKRINDLDNEFDNLGYYTYALGKFYFAANAGDRLGKELWSSDGTDQGTSMIQDINPGDGSSSPVFRFVYKDQLYLTAYWAGYYNFYVLNNTPIPTIFVWTGAVDNTWENPGNWDVNTVPAATSDAFINSGEVEINSNVIVKHLTVKKGASLKVNEFRRLTVLK